MIIAGVVLVSQLGINNISPGSSLGKIAANAYENMANVASVSATIPPNEYNVLAMEFSQKETELTLREQALLTKEASLDAKYQEQISANKRLNLYVLGGVTLLLLLLIFFNFYFDMKREEERERSMARYHEGELSTHL